MALSYTYPHLRLSPEMGGLLFDGYFKQLESYPPNSKPDHEMHVVYPFGVSAG